MKGPFHMTSYVCGCAGGGEPPGAKALSARKSLVAQLAAPPAHPAPVAGSLPVPGPPAGSSGTVLIIFPDNPQRVRALVSENVCSLL